MKFFKSATAFIIFNILVAIFTFPLLVAYGPFSSFRDIALHTVLETRRGPRIMAMVMSQDTIDKYMKKTEDSGANNGKALRIDPNKHDPAIKVVKGETNKFTYYMMLISDPTRVKVVASKDIGETGERVSDMAKRVNAVGAINGGGFIDHGWEGNGGTPIGMTIADGKVISNESDPNDYVIGIDDTGKLMIGKYNYQEVKNMKINNSLGFPGPVLIRDGQPLNIDNGGLNPRTAIGQKEDGTIIFLVVDGRSYKSLGASYYDIQQLMLKNGAVNAINLDGGSSTTMFYEGDVINNPGNLMGERYVPTSFVVMPSDR